MVEYITISEERAGQRVDNFLMAHWQRRCPKSRIYRAIRTGEVRINKGRVKPTYRLLQGDCVRLPPITTVLPKPQTGLERHLDLDQVRLFEDDYLLVINKPSGMPVHAGSGFPFGVVDCLRHHYPKHAFLDLVHRLDRGTSGVLVLAKKKSTLRLLQDTWREGGVEKTYLAIVGGLWQAKEAITIDQPLRYVKEPRWHKTYIHPEGKPSVTKVRLLQSFDQGALIEAKPLTGRMHQIRVHCQFLGHPLLGDDLYGGAKAPRLCLHASSIAFEHPVTKRVCEIETKPPSLFGDLIGQSVA